MSAKELFANWAPRSSPWSRFAKPVLFAEMKVHRGERQIEKPPAWDASWAATSPPKMCVIVDLPGADAVHYGLALARVGYRPVPLFNACSGPHEVVPQAAIARALAAGAAELEQLALAPDSPPAFLLDSRRAGPAWIETSSFDNRWPVFADDLPSPDFMRARGIESAVLVRDGTLRMAPDLAAVLNGWAKAGILLRGMTLDDAGPIEIAVPRSSRVGRLLRRWSAALRPRGPFGGYGGRLTHG